MHSRFTLEILYPFLFLAHGCHRPRRTFCTFYISSNDDFSSWIMNIWLVAQRWKDTTLLLFLLFSCSRSPFPWPFSHPLPSNFF
ncbi:hypothetical protein B0T24DRAFT_160018 [Lasiosphaeria ovina]|uniref:Uncharacterized protein n=1 Tax=Lasiosphaeria ovina TaxID=92902 RepID=A0AAE0NDA6_9PEZI|nr:hypothetical protein B0T24DRAFT_160018 [Lasiosphaeria ovina]